MDRQVHNLRVTVHNIKPREYGYMVIDVSQLIFGCTQWCNLGRGFFFSQDK